MSEMVIAPGARIKVRDAEWLVRRTDRTETGGLAISAIGLSDIVKNKACLFLDEIDKKIEVIDPLNTKFVLDSSPYYRNSLLYIESLLRNTTPTDNEKLYIGHQGAMDMMPYQLDPAIQALKEPRQRILIADAVGLGKTLEAGILTSELIKRGKGKRILVVTVKSMLTQFQKEFWSRFTIPLTRLDSIGLQRVRSKIPTNHNPFYYYDKAIISVDTLKQENDIRISLEKCYWDIIIIDEAHNVAERSGNSLRSKLARLLSNRSDTMIMLSATPHDGKAKSFASLMNMLNPTAIANPEKYTAEDIKGLCIRRFKKNVIEQLRGGQQDRKVYTAKSMATATEEICYDYFVDMTFTRLDQRKGGGMLFKTTLEKGLFSSPVACRVTVAKRIKRLEQEATPEALADIESLKGLIEKLDKIIPAKFSKYQKLLELLRARKGELGWTGKSDDRMVIFTERIDTLDFLRDNLIRDMKIKATQIETLHGRMSDIEQQRIVEAFGNDSSKIRLLIASDVASEGINLHYLSHKMIHFDIPWSLMAFQQRNGRIDRYGQEQEPHIAYLTTECNNAKIKGDLRVLELLIEKDKKAEENIGDPSVFMGVYDIDAEEEFTAKAIEANVSAEAFDQQLETNADFGDDFNPLALLLGDDDNEPAIIDDSKSSTAAMPTVYAGDYDFFNDSIEYLKQQGVQIQVDLDHSKGYVELTATAELEERFKLLPSEIMPDNKLFRLTDNRDTIMKAIKDSRKDENSWPNTHLLWQQHPVMEWLNDKVVAAFGRQEAPVLTLNTLKENETVIIASGLIPNRKGHPVLYYWLGVHFVDGKCQEIYEFDEVIDKFNLLPKQHGSVETTVDHDDLSGLLKTAVAEISSWIEDNRNDFVARTKPILDEKLDQLKKLQDDRYEQLELKFGKATTKTEKGRRETDAVFDEYKKWIEDTMQTENNPYIRIVAALKGNGKGER
jgi:superfamily II DNA or RNA helicase